MTHHGIPEYSKVVGFHLPSARLFLLLLLHLVNPVTTLPPLSWVIECHEVPGALDTSPRYTACPPLRWCVLLFGPPRPDNTLNTDWKSAIETEGVRMVECKDNRVVGTLFVLRHPRLDDIFVFSSPQHGQELMLTELLGSQRLIVLMSWRPTCLVSGDYCHDS